MRDDCRGTADGRTRVARRKPGECLYKPLRVGAEFRILAPRPRGVAKTTGLVLPSQVLVLYCWCINRVSFRLEISQVHHLLYIYTVAGYEYAQEKLAFRMDYWDKGWKNTEEGLWTQF